MLNTIDYDADHMCPVFERIIDCNLCYESVMALKRFVKVSSVPELSEITDIEQARRICEDCLYSRL